MKSLLPIKHFLTWAVLSITMSAYAQNDKNVTVSDCHLDGWFRFTEPTGLLVFANGPAPAPLSNGSVEFSLGPDGHGKAALLYFGYAFTPLTAFTELSYSTYVQDNFTGQAPAIELAVDTTGDGIGDDRLVFEPVYQTGQHPGPAQNGGHVALGTWQRWDALIGGWWARSSGMAGPPTYTLASYAASHPGARVALISSFGSLVLTAGGGNNWNHFVGFADALTIGVRGESKTFDFEACGDHHESQDITICHKDTTMKVSIFELLDHLQHGDQLGACNVSWDHVLDSLAHNFLPDIFHLSNFPNPFSQTTQIRYTVPYSGHVRVKVTDAAGRQRDVLVNADQQAGEHTINFDGGRLTKGIYYYTVEVQSEKGFFTKTKSMTLAR